MDLISFLDLSFHFNSISRLNLKLTNGKESDAFSRISRGTRRTNVAVVPRDAKTYSSDSRNVRRDADEHYSARARKIPQNVSR